MESSAAHIFLEKTIIFQQNYLNYDLKIPCERERAKINESTNYFK